MYTFGDHVSYCGSSVYVYVKPVGDGMHQIVENRHSISLSTAPPLPLIRFHAHENDLAMVKTKVQQDVEREIKYLFEAVRSVAVHTAQEQYAKELGYAGIDAIPLDERPAANDKWAKVSHGKVEIAESSLLADLVAKKTEAIEKVALYRANLVIAVQESLETINSQDEVA